MPTVDQIADAMVTQLATLAPSTGQPVTTSNPVYTVQRYAGNEFKLQEGMKRGISGRCPAVRVRYASDRTIRTTIGRRFDRVESTFDVIVATDAHRSKDDRKSIFAIAQLVRSTVGARAFGFAMTPLRYARQETLIDDEQMMALRLSFTCRHRVDFTIDPGTDTVNEARGSIVNAAVAHTSIPHAPTVTPQGTSGTTAWGYAIVGIDATGLRTLISPTGTTATGAAVLNGSSFNRVTWSAYPGIVTYEIERVSAGGTPATTGKIGTTTSLVFDDTGLASLGATPPDSLHVDMHEVFP